MRAGVQAVALWAVCCGLAWPGGGWAGCGGPSSARAETPATERVELLDGRAYEGLVESQDDVWINLIEVQRPPGRPMYLVVRPIERSAVKSVRNLAPDARAKLRRYVEEVTHRAEIEAGKMEAVRLQARPQGPVTHYLYRGKWFALESTADEETTRRIVVRLEQVFTAYRQVLPPRIEPEAPLRVVVCGSLEEYREYLERFGLGIANRAVFLATENLVVAGSELSRFAAAQESIQARHAEMLEEVRQRKADLPGRLEQISRQLQQQGKSPSEIKRLLNRQKRQFEEQIERLELEIKRAERQNEQEFTRLAGQMLVRLYHEAFHAYLDDFVYPHREYDVPAWLNEGLAMVFEVGLPEGGSLRLDAPNASALATLKADLAGPQPLALEQVLAADSRQFLVVSAAASQESQRYYAYAWGLVYYLTFQQRLLGSAALDRYVSPSAKTLSPRERFERLVGQPLEDFDKRWRDSMRRLR